MESKDTRRRVCLSDEDFVSPNSPFVGQRWFVQVDEKPDAPHFQMSHSTDRIAACGIGIQKSYQLGSEQAMQLAAYINPNAASAYFVEDVEDNMTPSSSTKPPAPHDEKTKVPIESTTCVPDSTVKHLSGDDSVL